MEQNELETMIPSETVRKYILETGWTFTDRQKAAILYHRDGPGRDVRRALYALRDSTADAVLKRQITEYLDREDRAAELFKRNESHYIYILTCGENTGYFLDCVTAIRQGVKSGAAFSISKHPAASAENEDRLEDGICRDWTAAIAWFGPDGAIESIDSAEIPTAEYASKDDWYDRFENMYYEVPNPFERGDIVRKFGTNEPGVVETSKSEWRDWTERCRSSEYHGRADWSDVQIRVVFPDEDGFFGHEHISPLYLEKCEEESLGGGALENLLTVASEIYRGRGSLEDLYYCQEMYRRAKRTG